MQAGKLNRRVTVLRKQAADDGFTSDGGTTWAAIGTIWASLSDLLDAERYRASELAVQATARMQVRYSSFTDAITPMDRILYNGGIYEITGIKRIGLKVGLEFTLNYRPDKVAP